ncbi:MAG: leucine-rich repeat domain-containing protein [Paludibacteraceae bacterium]|nr:leucine-rich repeat domain-containing protein [Paludibacteraceae bacterium]
MKKFLLDRALAAKEKITFFVLLFAALVLKGTSAYAEVSNGTCGEQVYWEYNDSTQVLRIYGNGAITERSYPYTAKRLEIEEGVTSVCTSAFSYSFTQLDTVVFASSVDSVGEYAFHSCSALQYCDLGRGVKYIGRGVFFGCNALTKVKWSDCLETIAGLIFHNWDAQGNDKSILLRDTLYIPATFKSNKQIGWWSFPNLDAVVWNAKHPTDPTRDWDSPLDIGSGYALSFKKIIFGDSVEYIPNYLCHEYNGDSIVLPEGVKEIGKYAFQECKKMTYVSLPTTLQKIGSGAFESCVLLEKAELPENLTEIGANVFYNCNLLADVRIPERVTYIGENAFSNITGQDSLYIPDKVVAVGGNAFENWSALHEISIGKNVTLIGDNAFKGDSAVTHITVWAAVPPMVTEGTLADIPDSAWLSVLPDSRKLYKEHPYWGRFRMSELPDSAMIQRTVTVDAAETTAMFTWPTDSATHSYQLDIYKDGNVFCKLTLGNKGQLLGISFSVPGRRMAQKAVADNFQPFTLSFQVTGLDAASRYNYVLSALDENGTPLHVYIGDFATLGYEGELQGGGDEVIPTPPVIPSNPEAKQSTGIVPSDQVQSTKIIMDGKLYLMYKERMYDVRGNKIAQ